MSMMDPRINAFRPELADIALRGLVNADRYVQGERKLCTAPLCPVRSEPSEMAEQISQALFGEEFNVFQADSSGWAWVQSQTDRYVGWMRVESLVDPPNPYSHRVGVPWTPIFSEPDIKSPPLRSLPLESRVIVARLVPGKGGTFAALETEGFLVATHTRSRQESAADFVSVAEWYLGVPYLWGGKSILGLDCSGLVQIALAAAGVPVPRDTDMQERSVGEGLPNSSPMSGRLRGDLIFWSGHVGIMTDPIYMLHANAHHMLVTSEPLEQVVDRQHLAGQPLTAINRLQFAI